MLKLQSHNTGAEDAAICNHHGLGGAGATDLGQAVLAACSKPSTFKFLYDVELPIKVRCDSVVCMCVSRHCVCAAGLRL